MTILKEELLEKNYRIRIYEAPYHLSRGFQREKWINEEVPFFNKKIYDFWKIYSTPFTKLCETYLSFGEEINERRDFIKKPLFVGLLEEETIGGIWVQDMIRKRKSKGRKEGIVHIKVLRENREIADSLMESSIKELKKGYETIYVGWGLRDAKDDPSKFLQRHGFSIKKEPPLNLASKKL